MKKFSKSNLLFMVALMLISTFFVSVAFAADGGGGERGSILHILSGVLGLVGTGGFAWAFRGLRIGRESKEVVDSLSQAVATFTLFMQTVPDDLADNEQFRQLVLDMDELTEEIADVTDCFKFTKRHSSMLRDAINGKMWRDKEIVKKRMRKQLGDTKILNSFNKALAKLK